MWNSPTYFIKSPFHFKTTWKAKETICFVKRQHAQGFRGRQWCVGKASTAALHATLACWERMCFATTEEGWEQTQGRVSVTTFSDCLSICKMPSPRNSTLPLALTCEGKSQEGQAQSNNVIASSWDQIQCSHQLWPDCCLCWLFPNTEYFPENTLRTGCYVMKFMCLLHQFPKVPSYTSFRERKQAEPAPNWTVRKWHGWVIWLWLWHPLWNIMTVKSRKVRGRKRRAIRKR